MKALIIEDETAAALNLAAVLRQVAPGVEVVGPPGGRGGGRAPFDLWYLSKQSGNTVAILSGVTLAAIAAIGSLLAFILPLSVRSKCAIAIF